MIALSAVAAVGGLLVTAPARRLLLDPGGITVEIRSTVGRYREVLVGLIAVAAAAVILLARPGPIGLAVVVGLAAITVGSVISIDASSRRPEGEGRPERPA